MPYTYAVAMDEDFDVWKRIIFTAIVTIIIAGMLGALYFWYQTRALNENTPAFAGSQTLTPIEQQRNTLKLLTAPPTTTTSTSKVPPAFTAPPQAPKTAAQQEQEQATLKALTAPAR